MTVVTTAHLRWRLAESAGGSATSVGYFVLTQLGVHVVRMTGAERTVVYQVLAGVAIGLLAFGITPAVILFTLAPGERLKAIMRHHGRELRGTIARCLWLLLSVVVVVVVALALDQGDPGVRWARYLVLATSAAAFVAVVRLLLVFTSLLNVIDEDRLSSRPELQRVEPRRRDAS